MEKTLSEGRKVIVLSEALRMFLIQKQTEGVSQYTIASYRSKIGGFVRFVTDKPLVKVTLEDAQNWVIHMQSSNKYANNHFQAGRKGFK